MAELPYLSAYRFTHIIYLETTTFKIGYRISWRVSWEVSLCVVTIPHVALGLLAADVFEVYSVDCCKGFLTS